MPVRMELARILIRELADMQIIELREADPVDAEAVRSFPIVIGLPEAQAIERRLKGTALKRPQTHDLLASIISDLGATLLSITVSDLREQTFFATLDIRTQAGDVLHIDSRPSDAIALGIAQDVPIFVEDHVLEGALRDPPEL
ncbi:MAG: bifunctional nuclease family protein [Tepidisphaera sp.]|jgi:bifunctional DNase/RNase